MTQKIWSIYLTYLHNILAFLLIICTLSYVFYYLAVQDAMLPLCAVTSGQYFTNIWQFHIATLELWATLLAGGSNNVGQD